MRILKRVAIGLGAIVLLALVVLYGASEWAIRRTHEADLVQVSVPKDAASIAEGARIAKIEGCRGCHGDDAAGSVWNDPPWFVATIAPPGLARKVASYSDAELGRLIRHGIRKDGTSLFIMPTVAHRNIADDDLGKLIAWIRTLRPAPKDVTRDTGFGPLGRVMLLSGQVPPSYQIGTVAPKQRPADLGRYYYDAVCSECHALDEPRPAPDGSGTAPALAPVAASYDPIAFRTLLHTGVAMGNRKLGLMSVVAKENFVALSDAEIVAIQDYLKREAAKQAK
ncbi:c-type cytochrome [Sphingomonas sp.]|uniref:c-type cytochrome n=1 Tax=Sphingomonas sp. TaxID=28214 RepID=UPI001B0032DC|nr:c-type cytochrome [Sphingomonas sp.]MBO9713610.1 c-type cytochrome [Sphingomonas sp.]